MITNKSINNITYNSTSSDIFILPFKSLEPQKYNLSKEEELEKGYDSGEEVGSFGLNALSYFEDEKLYYLLKLMLNSLIKVIILQLKLFLNLIYKYVLNL